MATDASSVDKKVTGLMRVLQAETVVATVAMAEATTVVVAAVATARSATTADRLVTSPETAPRKRRPRRVVAVDTAVATVARADTDEFHLIIDPTEPCICAFQVDRRIIVTYLET